MRLLNRLTSLLRFASICFVLSCASAGDKMKMAYDAEAKKDYDQAEKLAITAADDTGQIGYDARRYLVEFYTKRKPDPIKQLYWMIEQAEHPHYATSTQFWLEDKIAERYRKGEGTSPDLSAACNWDLKAYNRNKAYIDKQRQSVWYRRGEAEDAYFTNMRALTSHCDSERDEATQKAVADSRQALEEETQRVNRRAISDAEDARKQAEWDRKRAEEQRIRQSRD